MPLSELLLKYSPNTPWSYLRMVKVALAVSEVAPPEMAMARTVVVTATGMGPV